MHGKTRFKIDAAEPVLFLFHALFLDNTWYLHYPKSNVDLGCKSWCVCQYNIMQSGGFQPAAVSQTHVLNVETTSLLSHCVASKLTNGFVVKVYLHGASDCVGDDKRRRRQVVGSGVGVNSAFKVSIS